MFDLTTIRGVERYLALTRFAATSVVRLAGGHANFTYRIKLREPCHAPGENPVETLVMKHARPYLALHREIPFDVERQEFEALSFQQVPKFVRSSSLLRTPKLYYEDYTQHVIIMSDCGVNSHTLNTVLQNGLLADNLARDIGVAVGKFIAQLHIATRNPTPGTPANTAKTVFATHHQARALICSAFYDTVVPTFTKVLSPPLELSPVTLAKLEAHVCRAKARITDNNDVMIMGDFRPGNFLVVLQPDPIVTIVDWEVARTGPPGMDLGQCLAEFHIIRVFHPESRACVNAIISGILKTYRAMILEKNDRQDAKRLLVEIAHEAASHAGIYMISVPPMLSWGGPELTRRVVLEGVQYVSRSVDGDEAWLRESVVGDLWGPD